MLDVARRRAGAESSRQAARKTHPLSLHVGARAAKKLERAGKVAKLDADLKDAEEDVADAKTDETRRLATERRDQINELKAALKL